MKDRNIYLFKKNATAYNSLVKREVVKFRNIVSYLTTCVHVFIGRDLRHRTYTLTILVCIRIFLDKGNYLNNQFLKKDSCEHNGRISKKWQINEESGFFIRKIIFVATKQNVNQIKYKVCFFQKDLLQKKLINKRKLIFTQFRYSFHINTLYPLLPHHHTNHILGTWLIAQWRLLLKTVRNKILCSHYLSFLTDLFALLTWSFLTIFFGFV